MPVNVAMKRNVICADPKTSIREIARIMADNHIGSVVITKNEKMVGIVTDSNVLSFVASAGDADATPVEHIMTRYVIFTSPEASLEKASELMIKHNIKKLPVLKNDKLVGIITTTDLAIAAPAKIKRLKKLISRSGI